METGRRQRVASLTTRLSFGDSGIRVGLAGAFVQRITASLLLGRFGEVFLRLGTVAPVALEAEAALSLARRLASGHGVVHVADGDRLEMAQMSVPLLALRD
jgi:hypothetical protein